jgi:hypothetical protein
MRLGNYSYKLISPNNISKWQMGFNSAFKGLNFEIKTNLVRVNTAALNSDRTGFTFQPNQQYRGSDF